MNIQTEEHLMHLYLTKALKYIQSASLIQHTRVRPVGDSAQFQQEAAK
ncbi:10728_t:CDS:2, partial [Gigaspora rosea]